MVAYAHSPIASALSELLTQDKPSSATSLLTPFVASLSPPHTAAFIHLTPLPYSIHSLSRCIALRSIYVLPHFRFPLQAILSNKKKPLITGAFAVKG